MFHGIVFASLFAASAPSADIASDLQLPVPIQAGGQPLDVQREGHSAPFAGDFDGDGVRDLLVGQYEQGRLRIYRNLGTNAEPQFDAHTWLSAGGQTGRVPEG
jgi:FG-GAP repeat